MVDSRAKGRVAETKIRDELRKLTSLKWERIPSSGALDAKHGLKGDLYIPKVDNIFCVEVKHYKDDHLTSKLLTGKTPQIEIWWEQACRQANQVSKKPLLIFKFDRSKIFVAFKSSEVNELIPSKRILLINDALHSGIVITLLEDFCKWKFKPTDWINNSE